MKAIGTKTVRRSEEVVLRVKNADVVRLLREQLQLPADARLVAVSQTRSSAGEVFELDDENDLTFEARWTTADEHTENVTIGEDDEPAPRRR